MRNAIETRADETPPPTPAQRTILARLADGGLRALPIGGRQAVAALLAHDGAVMRALGQAMQYMRDVESCNNRSETPAQSACSKCQEYYCLGRAWALLLEEGQ